MRSLGKVWLFSTLLVTAWSAQAAAPVTLRRADGASLVRALGPTATQVLAPRTGLLTALVELPEAQAQALGLQPVTEDIARWRGSAAQLETFVASHPALPLEVSPPLQLLLDRAGRSVRFLDAQRGGATGRGVLVGVADTGIDTSHPDFVDANGHSRIAWLLDFSQPVQNLHPEVESKFAVLLADGRRLGAVFSGADIDALRAADGVPSTDTIGHGTHVASLAAGSPPAPTDGSPWYRGVAPEARLVVVRLTRGSAESIENDDLTSSVRFIFDRADAEGQPCVANLSLGTDFGPHDGSTLWERSLLANVGADKPGHVLVAAAGNSGSAAEFPIHQSLRLDGKQTVKVPVATDGAENGAVSVWVTYRNLRAPVRVGLEGPDGRWLPPLEYGREGGRNTADYNAAVVHGPSSASSPVPDGSTSAIVAWQGRWPAGTYQILLEGEADVELYLQGSGDAARRGAKPARFFAGMRAGTINLPADHPDILSVGCTVNRPSWVAKSGLEIELGQPRFDRGGAFMLEGGVGLESGSMCYFSSAGPNASGVPKPEIAAPGAVVAAAMSQQALPGNASSMFANPRCPLDPSTQRIDPACMQVDDLHAVSSGTSMAAPLVTGAVALLLQQNPTLTQAEVKRVLQAGAHDFTGAVPYASQSGPGELDVMGSLRVLQRMASPELALPTRATSWATVSNDHADASGSEALQVLLELRNTLGEPADLFEPERLRADVRIDGVSSSSQPSIDRLAPGLYRYTITVPPGSGGGLLRVGATFDGAEVVEPKVVPIGMDAWRTHYASRVFGGCGIGGAPASTARGGWIGLLGVALLARRSFTRRRG